ncbi:hypothetical protein [Peribacillus glennii]|uniref:hypothetical protein n=1 Tax=Peribacillus glennii TaxID=2303991 RepID=UPI001F29B929|nr:hypothetical protein [Peribacillus glennii]
MFFSCPVLDASSDKDTPLINIISTGKTRTSVVDEFFLKTFNDPADGYKKFDEYSAERVHANEKVIPQGSPSPS